MGLGPSPGSAAAVLSIVIPTLDAAATLGSALDSVAGAAHEVVVADGGSRDDTRAVAAARGAIVVDAPRGRGPQLATGAAAARGDWLLFLHADTVLEAGWAGAVSAFAAGPAGRDRAAVFRFALDDPGPAARRLEALVAWRTRRLALPYGDQGLLISRALYQGIGGFRPLPLMEDVDIVRRLGRRRLVVLDAAAVTSAERYRRGGYLLRPLRNLACLGLYFLGVPLPLIARIYP